MADETKVKVTLKHNVEAGTYGLDGRAGDTVELDADVAERWIAVGIAEPVAGATAEAQPAAAAPEEPPAEGGAGPTGRRRA